MFKDIFQAVKQKHGITGKAISELTGISQIHISQFLNGKRDVSSSYLWRMIEAMDNLSPGAKKDFWLQLVKCVEYDDDEVDLTALIQSMQTNELSKTLFTIAETLQRQSNSLSDNRLGKLKVVSV